MAHRLVTRLRALLTRRRLVAVVLTTLALTVTAMAAAMAFEGSSMYDNVSPEPQVHGRSETYPSDRYGLDWHIGDVIDTPHTSAFDKKSPFDILPNPGAAITGAIVNSVPTGIHPEDMPALIAENLASWGWDFERFVSGLVITLFTFAFSLDPFSGQNSALRPIQAGVNNLWDALGGEWLGLALACLGGWIAKEMAGRNFTHTIGGVARSLLCAMAAMAIIANMGWFAGGILHFSQEFANGVMGKVTGVSTANAKDAGATALHNAIIDGPWQVLNFGGTVHCVNAANQPVKPWGKDCKTKINTSKYTDRWLKAGPPNGKERTLEYQAILNGKNPSTSEISNAGMKPNSFDGYKLSAADKPAVDMQQSQSAGQRLVGVAVIGIALLGAWLLIGGLSLGVIVSTFIALAWLLAAPFAVIAALIPGPGVEAFMAWLKGLVLYLTRPLWYGVILAIAIAVLGAILSSTAYLGWLLSFVAMAGFLWFLVFKHKTIYMGLVGVITRHGGRSGAFGGGGGQGGSARQKITQAYYQQRMVRSMANPVGEAAKRVAFGAKEGPSKPPRKGGVMGHLKLGAQTGAELVDERNNAQLVAMQGRNAAAQSPRARAVTELARERKRTAGKASADLSAETKRRDRAGALRLQQKTARLEGGDLSPSEQKELRDLESRRMPKRDYDALAASVTDEAARAKQPDHGFSEEEIAKRARVIVARDAAAEHEEAVNGNSGDGDGRRRLDGLRDRVRRQRDAPVPLDGAQGQNRRGVLPTRWDAGETPPTVPPAAGSSDWSAREWKGDDWKNGAGDQPPQDPPRRIRLRRPPPKPPEDKP